MFADNRFVKNRLSCFQKSSRERERERERESFKRVNFCKKNFSGKFSFKFLIGISKNS